MKKKSTAVFPNALNGGLYLGLALVIYSIIMWASGLTNMGEKSTFIFVLQWIITATVLFFVTKSYRDLKLNGTITYGRILGFQTLSGLVAGVILAIYTYLFFTVIDTDALNQIRIAQEEAMLAQGLSAEQVEMSMKMMERFSNPITMSLGNIFAMPVFGFIISLIEGIFLKKEGNPFDTAMADIDEDK